ncbi:xanthine dehydrogenase family protein molybdopterin-binding subunit [Falsibacillus pallidus]|uniref:xanthine dehydrogenase family protein molybdopterin-binding subunit n=1 Tax=Falsibacillus pallidus TaxID=493781 RepID=UPI003D98347B
MDILGKSVIRKEAFDKVSGRAVYTNDIQTPGMLHGVLVTSTEAHAKILDISVDEALAVKGVRACILGKNLPLTGEQIRDRPPIAYDRVRYYGEAIAVIVADSYHSAKIAASLVKVFYQPLPVINSPSQAIHAGAPLIHKQLEDYHKEIDVFPVPGTNIANRLKVRKGDMKKGWDSCTYSVEESYFLPPADHAAMELRCSICQIDKEGNIEIHTSSQAPFMVKKLIGSYFDIEIGKVTVKTPLVGGGYGGKASVQLELLAYLASKAVDGRKVKIMNTREEDILTSPGHIGLEARIKLGCSQDGKIKAAEILYLFDGGAYSDKAVDLARAAAVDCTGPYHIENIKCDSLCVYTNHPYAAPFRGFSHSELLFAFERTMDSLAEEIGMDVLAFREQNSILPGDYTPTRVRLTRSNLGNLPKCIERLRDLMDWNSGQFVQLNQHIVRAKGIACVWKTSTIDQNASSGVILTFNSDGSINLMSGVVEIGTGTKTVLAQMLAEKLKMDISLIHVQMEIDTKSTPEHWKTVASRGVFMAGKALLEAADDVMNQLKELAACVLRVKVQDLEVGYGKVYLKDDPLTFFPIKDLAYGYKFPDGNAIGGQIIGKGNYIMRNMTNMDPETGEGRLGPEWTVAAQGVEIELNKKDWTYRVLKAVSVVDIGRVLNEKAALGQVMGAMSMGISYGGRERLFFDQKGRVLNPQLRTYRPLRYGEHPEYKVEFVHTYQLDAPYGARGVGEHGLLGMPAALGNALTLAAGVKMNELPLLPEMIWKAKRRT